MKKLTRAIPLAISLLIMFSLLGCAQIAQEGSEPANEAHDSYAYVGAEYEIPALEGSVHVPDGYIVLASEADVTDEACESLSADPEQLRADVTARAAQGEALIVAKGTPYADGRNITIKVNEPIYDGIDYAEIKRGEAELYALNAALGFSAADYDIVEGNGNRFFAFASKQDGDNVFTYGTILGGHMVYLSMNTGDEAATEAQKANLEAIAFSIQSGL